MERWKELLKAELDSVIKGYKEIGKNTAELEEIMRDIANLDKAELTRLLNAAHVEYFAGKLHAGTYHAMVDMEAKQKEGTNA